MRQQLRTTYRRATGVALATLLIAAGLLAIGPAEATDYPVTTTSDDGPGSLRQAVIDANGNPGIDTISFAIPEASCSAAGVCTIALLSVLPEVTGGVVVDGTTQPRYGTAPANVCATASQPSYLRVEIAGATGADIFDVSSPEATTIRGLSFINGYWGAHLISAAAHRVECNHFGVTGEGGAAGQLWNGILLEYSAKDITIGTNGDGVDDIGERNVFGGLGWPIWINNNSYNRIAGNYFGFGADGVTAMPIRDSILVRQGSHHNLIGTDRDGVSDERERNVIGNCSSPALRMEGATGTDNRIVGNWIGVNAAGEPAGNSVGILVQDSIPELCIQLNRIEHNGVGIQVYDDSTLDVSSTNNCLVGNGTAVEHGGSASSLFLKQNWWGASDGPSGVGSGSGDVVVETGTGTVDVEPWLTSGVGACGFALLSDGFETGDTSAWSVTVD